MSSIFFEIGIVIIVATAFAVLVRLLRQPPLVGYILTGIVLGPIGAQYLQNHELLEAMQQLGVAFLLFLIGIELDWNKAKQQLHTASLLGLIQVIGSFLTGFALIVIFKQPLVTGLFLGTALIFSSTVIVVKLLSESHDLNSLHGRLSVGILLFQDIIAALALVIIGGLSQPSSLGVGSVLLLLFLKTAALLTIIWGCATYLLPFLFIRIAKSGEMLFLASLAWCFIFAIAVTQFGIPLEIGALLAGISLASLPYSFDILTRLRSLRDFFVILLFVSVGSNFVLPGSDFALLTLLIVLATVFGKPLLAFLTLVFRGYKSRTAFFTALTQSQLSEFSILVVALGLEYGYVTGEISSIITFTAVVSLFISTILLTNRIWLYTKLQHVLRRFEHKHAHNHLSQAIEEKLEGHIIIFGYHRMGYHILKKIQTLKRKVIVVDFNPDIVKKLRSQDIVCLYGDVQDDELMEQIQINKSYMVISTIPHLEESSYLIDRVKKLSKKTILIVTAHHIDDALHYYKQGASYVILPHLLGGEHVADLITNQEGKSLGDFLEKRSEEVKLLRAKTNALYYD